MANVGVFTTVKVVGGIPFYFDKHQTRLLSHAKQLKITPPAFSLKTIHDYLQENNLEDCALRITIKHDGNLIIEHRSLPTEKPIKVITVEDTRNSLKTIKTTDRRVNDSARKLAEEKNADDALFIHDGTIIESTYANVFSLDEQQNIITPPLDKKGLKGIARQVIMERLPVIEKTIPKDLSMPLVTVNSLRVQEIAMKDSKKLPDAKELAEKLRKVLAQ